MATPYKPLEQDNIINFYYCNKASSKLVDKSAWDWLGYRTLCGHINQAPQCVKIQLLDQEELDRFIIFQRNAISKYNKENEKFNKEYDWSCTFKVNLLPCEGYNNTYTILSCEVVNKRFCLAK
jgi:hypothetical protein